MNNRLYKLQTMYEDKQIITGKYGDVTLDIFFGQVRMLLKYLLKYLNVVFSKITSSTHRLLECNDKNPGCVLHIYNPGPQWYK